MQKERQLCRSEKAGDEARGEKCGIAKLEIQKAANQAVKNKCEKWSQKKKRAGALR
jgi:hypothetical protein